MAHEAVHSHKAFDTGRQLLHFVEVTLCLPAAPTRDCVRSSPPISFFTPVLTLASTPLTRVAFLKRGFDGKSILNNVLSAAERDRRAQNPFLGVSPTWLKLALRSA